MVEIRCGLSTITFYSRCLGVDMFELKEILDELISEVKRKGQYDCQHEWEESYLVTELLLGELLDPNGDSYPYFQYQKGIWSFKDSEEIPFNIRLVYQPTSKNPHFELKSWWVENGKRIYDRLPETPAWSWDKRSNTIAKIFRNEIILEFEKQNLSDLMYILPMDSKRYQFSLRMIKKFIPKEWELIEDFPKKITVKKK